MIVCHCQAITDRAIRDAVREGASSCRQVGSACGAGNRCGGCRPAIQQLIREESPLPVGQLLSIEPLAAA